MNQHPRIRDRCWSALLPLGCAVLLLGCVPSDPPPDVLKTQREALEKARGVDATIQNADRATRQQADDASR